MELMDYIGEIVVGLVLLGFAVAFRTWGNRLRDMSIDFKEISHKMFDRLDSLAKEFHVHTLKTEGRVTRVETKIESLTDEVRGRRNGRNGNGRGKTDTN